METTNNNSSTPRRRQYLIIDVLRSEAIGANMTQAALLAYLYTRLAMTETPTLIGQEYYYQCDEQFAIDAVPMLPRKRDTVRRLLRDFSEMGVLRLTAIDGHLYFTPSPLLRTWGYDYNPTEDVKFSTAAEKNPNLGKKSEPRKKIRTAENFTATAEKNPRYINNNIENNNLDCLHNQCASEQKKAVLGAVGPTADATPQAAKQPDATPDADSLGPATPQTEPRKKAAARREADAKKSIFRHSDLARRVTARPDGSLDFSAFAEAFPDDLRREADLGYYFTAVLNWSDMNDTKILRTERGWTATVRQFIARDRDRGQLHRPRTATAAPSPQTAEMLRFMEETRLD
jgi:hypothetical protein